MLHDGVLTEPFVSLTGVKPGDLLSPLLFLVMMDKTMRATTHNEPRRIAWSPTERLEELDYADDACLLAHTYIRICRQRLLIFRRNQLRWA